MPHSKAKKIREAISKTDQILFEEWDPIGVNEDPETASEYSSYAPALFNIARRGNIQSVIDQLQTIQTEYMGLSHMDPGSDLRIAQKLVDIASQLDCD